MKQMVYDVPGVESVTLAVGAELSLLNLYPAKYKKSEAIPLVDHDSVIQRSDRNSFHIKLGKSFSLPLYHFLFNEQLYIGRCLSSFIAVGADKVDPHYLIELEYFGFPTGRKSLLKNVHMLFPGDEVMINAEELIWLDETLPEQPGLHATLVKPQAKGDVVYNLLPKVAADLFSPFDHVFFAEISQQLQDNEDSVLEISKDSLPKNFGLNKERADVFNGAHKSNVVEGVDLQEYTDQINGLIKSSWEASGSKESLGCYLAEQFYYPFILFQLNTLAAGAGKEIRVVESANQENSVAPVFSLDDAPIVNVYESFQRVFFYGNQWLSRVWFFIPPMISAKIIKRQQKYSGGEQHICIYALTLDYLLRFYPLKVGNVIGD
ncbi:hypothetical protein ACJJJB_06015 [Microbulbifer sp. ANSA001]|uniref:hypothetical protein n=1 Tax=Microbulbifer sp. ANSA001 TaxID=3243358 RepID=UPI004043450C